MKNLVNKIINTLEHQLEYIEYDKIQAGDKDVDIYCDGFKEAIECIKECYLK